MNIIKKFTSGLLASLALVAMAGVAMPQPAEAGIFLGVSINIGPPALPYYEQPPVPTPGYIWQPGFWAYGPYGYYWVPGTWVQPPQVGYLWTPGYWGYDDGNYTFNPGYWAQSVGYYGGINYGYGYYGNGYYGGRWHGRDFEYNTAITSVNRTYVRNVYVDRTVYVSPNRWSRVDYNGGPHGIVARPTAFDEAVLRERHFNLTPAQVDHVNYAAADRSYRLSYNGGRPGDPAVEHPFNATYRPPAVAPGRETRSAFAAGAAAGAVAGVAAAHAAAAHNRAVQYQQQHPATGAYRAPVASKTVTNRTTTVQHYTTATHTQTYRAPATTHYVAPVHTQTYRAPVTTYHAPVSTYHAPVHTYRAPVTTYHAPVTTYHAPVTTQHYVTPTRTQTYHAPVQTYHAPVQTYHAPIQRGPAVAPRPVSASQGAPAAGAHGGGGDRRR